MIKAIVGANWGDEGKGKITDVIAAQSDIVIRFQGGSNAGHTIINNYGKFALHQLPSGIFYDHTTSIIGNGVALSVENFIKELSSLEERNVPKPNILISDRAQIVMPYHIELDTLEEARLSENSFGSTKSGIAPFYSDKYAKIGFQISELYDDETELKKKIERVLAVKNTLYEHLYHQPPLKVDDVFNKLMEYKELIAPYVTDTFEYLYEAVKEGKNILLEGQLGALKDPDFGIYPMVTSSSTLAGYGAVGAGLPPVLLVQVNLSVKSLAKKQMNCVAEAVTAENLVQLQVVPEEWDGWIWLLHVMAVVYKVLPQLHLQYWMCWVIWMKFLFALRMSWTENVLTISRPQRS